MSVQILPLSLIFLVHNEWPDIAPLGKISLVQVESPDSSYELNFLGLRVRKWNYSTMNFFNRQMSILHRKPLQIQGVPKKHGNSVTNSILSLLLISIEIPNFKSHNIIMSARVYFMKRVKDYKDVSIMSPQDEQWRRTSLLCMYCCNFLVLLTTTVCS